MIKKSILSLLSLCILLGFNSQLFAYAMPPADIQMLPPFNTLQIGSGVNVVVYTGQPFEGVAIDNITPELLTNIKKRMTKNTLNLAAYDCHPHCSANQRSLVKVYMRQFHNLDFIGDGSVDIKNVHNGDIALKIGGRGNVRVTGPAVGLRYLEYHSAGNLFVGHVVDSMPLTFNYSGGGDVTLDGVINLSALSLYGAGNVNLGWVKSPFLRIKGNGNATMHVAGITKLLHIAIDGYDHVDARYLRAENAFVKTAHRARADVTVKDTLYAAACDRSNIYYFNTPEFVTMEDHCAGSILTMAHVPGALVNFP